MSPLDTLPKLSGGSSGEPTGASSDLIQILRDAEKEMRELGDQYVSTDHIILAIAAQPGAVFRIRVAQGVVRYSKDGLAFYSSPASKGALSFDVQFADVGASISNVTISNGP